MAFLYRGFHAGHPQQAAAKNGVIVPGNVSSTVSPEEHNRGGWSAGSPFTSWTPDEQLARSYACAEKGHGTLVCVDEADPGPDDTWEWVRSPNNFGEEEVLLKGIRIGVEVFVRELPCRGYGEAEE